MDGTRQRRSSPVVPEELRELARRYNAVLLSARDQLKAHGAMDRRRTPRAHWSLLDKAWHACNNAINCTDHLYLIGEADSPDPKHKGEFNPVWIKRGFLCRRGTVSDTYRKMQAARGKRKGKARADESAICRAMDRRGRRAFGVMLAGPHVPSVSLRPKTIGKTLAEFDREIKRFLNCVDPIAVGSRVAIELHYADVDSKPHVNVHAHILIEIKPPVEISDLLESTRKQLVKSANLDLPLTARRWLALAIAACRLENSPSSARPVNQRPWWKEDVKSKRKGDVFENMLQYLEGVFVLECGKASRGYNKALKVMDLPNRKPKQQQPQGTQLANITIGLQWLSQKHRRIRSFGLWRGGKPRQGDSDPTATALIAAVKDAIKSRPKQFRELVSDLFDPHDAT